MRIWIVTVGETLPTDGHGDDRLLRAGILATMLAQRGKDVVWWSSTFDHVRKQQRFPGDTSFRLESGVLLKLLHGCGYARNVSLKRLVDHAMLARKFTRQAGDMPRPDVILCSLPPLELPVAATRYGERHRVPVIIDVRDLWPDLFLELVPHWARATANVFLAPMWKQARQACRKATTITGNSPHFVDWGIALAGRARTPWDRHFWHGYAARTPGHDQLQAAYAFWSRWGVASSDEVFTACFFGAIGPQSELETVIEAARLLERSEKQFRFVLCGKGDRLDALRKEAADCPSVIFPGWIGAPEIWTLMRMSAVGLAVYRSNVGYVSNLPNKPIEYLSAGLPVISSLSGFLEDFLAQHGCGATFPNGNAQCLAGLLSDLHDDRARLKNMADNAHRVFAEEFAAEKVYGEMIDYIEKIAMQFGPGDKK